MTAYGGKRANAGLRGYSGRVLLGGNSNFGGTGPALTGEVENARLQRRAEKGPRDTATGSAQQRQSAPAPIWFAALQAASCLATGGGVCHDVDWKCANGRALYTNLGADPETIHPLGVSLACGETLAVHWTPGETGYTMEVLQAHRLCA